MSKVQITFKPASMRGALLARGEYAEKVVKIARKGTFLAATKAHAHMAKKIRYPKSGVLQDREGFKRLNARHLKFFGDRVAEMNVTTKGKKHTMMVQNFHVVSAPGEAPANDTGNLLGSIFHFQDRDLPWGVLSFVKVLARYSKWLEYGTKKMEPRPFIRPTRRFIEPIFKDYMVRQIRRMAKGGAVDTGDNSMGGGE